VTKIERALASDGGDERLSGEFAGLFKLRVGDYRVIYAKTTEGYLVPRIGRRSEVYRKGRP
jgi:mRNA-degrading endonuclease RelE of RelBE toxin-antitoxin system